MKRILIVALMGMALAGCEKPEVHQERRITVAVESVHLTSKSNSKVTLRDTKTGVVYERNRLSCSRGKAKNVQVGKLWDVTERTYYYPESKRYTTELVGTRAICELSN